MSNDSIQLLHNHRMNRIHANISGTLHKGHSSVPHSATIPSKFQTIVIDNADKKGFLSKARRFQYEMTEMSNPGPIHYNIKEGLGNQEKPSFSKKGSCGFPSKQKRSLQIERGCGIGPNSYNLPSTLLNKKDFNHSIASASFHPDYAVKYEKPSASPGANKYNISGKIFKASNENHSGAESSFKSKSKRDIMNLIEAVSKPGPGAYTIETADKIVHDSDKTPISSFKSKSLRQMAKTPELGPGPGTYKPHEPIGDVKKQVFPMKHYLCLSAPALPLPPTPAEPGPGQYNLIKYDPSKHFMASAVFLSNTSRWSGGGSTGLDPHRTNMPGPSHYQPQAPIQQSFHYNANRRWVC